MGLLDNFSEFAKTPEGQGLLAATFGGLAGAQRGAPLNSIGRAGLAGITGYGNAIERQDQLAQREEAKKFRDMQMAQFQAQIDAQKKAQAAAEAKQAALPRLWQAEQTQGNFTLDPITSQPTITKASTVGAPKLDWKGALAAGYTPQEIEALSKMQDLGKQEVARTIKGVGADGKEYEYQIDKYGNKIGDGFGQYKAPIMQDIGGNVAALDPYTLKPVLNIPKTMTFGDKNAAATLALSRERLNFDKAGGAEGAKPQLVDGQWVYKPDAKNPQGRVVPVQGMADKPMNDSQSKANLFGQRMLEAEKVIQSVSDKADRPGLIKRTAEATVGVIPGWLGGDQLVDIAGAATNWTQSAAQQQVEQAQDNFLNAVLRRESGAVIGADEKRNARKQYFPEVGDSEERIAQKAANRKTAIEGVLAEVPRNSRPKQSGGATGSWGSGVKFLGFE